MTSWSPTTDQGKVLKAALEKLAASTQDVILTPVKQQKDAQDKHFILQAHSYFGSYAFLNDGFQLADAYFVSCLRS